MCNFAPGKMKKVIVEYTARMLLLFFAYFYCGNALCIHSHLNGNYYIVHSHPYLPGTPHSHSDNSIVTIANFNSAMTSMEVGSETFVDSPYVDWCTCYFGNEIICASTHEVCNLMRAPPTV